MSYQTGIFGHWVKCARLVLEEFGRAFKFPYPTIVQKENLITVHDGFEPVGNGEYGAVFEFRSNCRLNQIVGFEINGGSGFVKN